MAINNKLTVSQLENMHSSTQECCVTLNILGDVHFIVSINIESFSFNRGIFKIKKVKDQSKSKIIHVPINDESKCLTKKEIIDRIEKFLGEIMKDIKN